MQGYEANNYKKFRRRYAAIQTLYYLGSSKYLENESLDSLILISKDTNSDVKFIVFDPADYSTTGNQDSFIEAWIEHCGCPDIYNGVAKVTLLDTSKD